MKTHLDNLNDCPLHKHTPFGMTNVSMTQLSIARYAGGCSYNGDHYTYFPDTDELVRSDVLKWRKKQAKKTHDAIKAAALAQAKEEA
jgi:hypothetical protein